MGIESLWVKMEHQNMGWETVVDIHGKNILHFFSAIHLKGHLIVFDKGLWLVFLCLYIYI